jgi:hypothetical protein
MYLRRTGRHSPSTHNSLVTATEGKSKESFGTGRYFATLHVTNKYYKTNIATLLFSLSRIILWSKRLLKSKWLRINEKTAQKIL